MSLKNHPKHLIYVKTKMDKQANKMIWFGIEKRVQFQPKWGRSSKLCVQQQQHQQRCDIFRNETPNTQPFTRNKSFSIAVAVAFVFVFVVVVICIAQSVLAAFFRWEYQFNGHLNAANILLASVSTSSSLFFSCSFIFLSTRGKNEHFWPKRQVFWIFHSKCVC